MVNGASCIYVEHIQVEQKFLVFMIGHFCLQLSSSDPPPQYISEMASLIILAVIIAAASASKHAQSKSEKSGKLSFSARTNKSTYDFGPVKYNMDANM